MIGFAARLYLFVLTMPIRHARNLRAVSWPVWIGAVVASILAGAVLVGIGFLVGFLIGLVLPLVGAWILS